MKVYLILGLLVTAACAEKKINLEDIERDNLRAESKTKTENTQNADETKYLNKPDVNQQQYQIPSQYSTLAGHSESYIAPQQFQDVKYNQVSPEQYNQHDLYAVHEPQYQQSSQVLPQQNVPLLQYYSGYQQQPEVPAKAVVSSTFETQKLNYQPEVTVGNHVQSVQQKAVTEKYTKAVNKGPIYYNVPATQLLSYYPHLDINSLTGGKGATQPALHQLPSDVTQQISIPLYAPVYNPKQLVSSVKTPYPYPTVLPATFTTKVTKGSAYALPVTSKKLAAPALPAIPLYVQPQQPLAQGKKLLYTQAYITPTKPQYVQQFVYTQPGLIYSDHAAAYSDIYARIPAYIQDNLLRGQANQYQVQQQLAAYVTPTLGHYEASKEISQEQLDQDLPQDYIRVPEEPKAHFVPPHLPAQNFKSAVTQLEPVPFEDEESLQVKDHHSLPSVEPKSLLDTYIPSGIIAAQDSARYRERPIKLEGGFLPSKVNFALKKRKSE